MANNISNNILKTIDMIVEDRVSKIKFDKTIEATINSIVNLNTGEYKIKYEENIFSAFSNNTSILYEIGDKVLVKIPEGDFTNKKIIESKSNGDISSNGDNSINNDYLINVIEPSWDEFYNYQPENEYSLISGIEPNQKIIYSYQNESNTIFQNYNTFYDKIQIKASFKTNFLNTHNKGNYGIKIILKVKNILDQSEQLIAYSLDTSSFIGAPYNYNSYSEQSVQIEVEKNSLINLDSIIFFQENMEVDKNIIYNEDGTISYNEITDIPNIFVKDIKLNFIELVDYSKSKYYLSISTPKGISFVDNNYESLSLLPVLRYYGKVINSNDYTCEWFKEDLSITAANENYNSKAGAGWLFINNEHDLIILKNNEIMIDRNYKLIVTYKEETILSKEINIRFFKEQFAIEQQNNNENISLTVFDILENKEYNNNVRWYVRKPDNAYSLFGDGNPNSIIINEYLIYSYIIFYASIKNELGQVIAQKSILIQRKQDSSDININFKGTDIYHYDANGDITILDADQDKTLTVKILSKSGQALSYRISWFINNVIISNTELNPKNSMFEKIWVDTENILHYHIKPKFKQNNNNNTFILKIELIDGTIIEQEKEILFIKDGDQGTNGTTYVCVVSVCDRDGVKLNGFHSLHYTTIDDQNSQDIIYLRAYVYKDGELINDNDNYNISYLWESKVPDNLIISSTSNNDIVQVQGKTVNKNYQNIIKVSIKVSNKNEIKLYNNFPIYISIGSNLIDNLIDLNIPNYVRYTSSGVDPVFTDSNLYFLYNGEDKIDLINTYTPNLISIEKKQQDEENYIYNLDPAETFDFSNGTGVLQLCIDQKNNPSKYIIYPIIMYLNTYGNQAINDWDGTYIKVDNENGTLLAPQIGAGIKNDLGQFSGVIMGQILDEELGKPIGLYGYNNGIQVFSLNNKGEAIIGDISKGYIKIDGTDGVIESSNYRTGIEGMQIDLYNGNIDINKGSINLGNGNFKVTSDGKVTIKSSSGESGDLITQIKIDAGKLSSRIEDAEGNINQLNITSSNLSSQISNANGEISSLKQTATSLTSRISNAENNISYIEQKVDNIRISVQNDTDRSYISLTAGGIEISSDTIRFTGGVVFESDLYEGNTSINGSCIDTGQIDADYINLYGEMQVGKSRTGRIGGYIGYCSGNSDTGIGVMSDYDTGQCICTSGGAKLAYGSDDYYIGVSDSNIFASEDIFISSDRRVKEDIRYDLDTYEDFFRKLKPCSYLMKRRTSGRRHTGFIAQELEEALIDSGKTAMDLAAFGYDEKARRYENNEQTPKNVEIGCYKIRYSELIALNTAMIQKLMIQIDDIKKQLGE